MNEDPAREAVHYGGALGLKQVFCKKSDGLDGGARGAAYFEAEPRGGRGGQGHVLALVDLRVALRAPRVGVPLRAVEIVPARRVLRRARGGAGGEGRDEEDGEALHDRVGVRDVVGVRKKVLLVWKGWVCDTTEKRSQDRRHICARR